MGRRGRRILLRPAALADGHERVESGSAVQEGTTFRDQLAQHVEVADISAEDHLSIFERLKKNECVVQ